MLFTQKGRKNITKILQKLAKESGIPYNTIRRWYYENEQAKAAKINRIISDTTPETPASREPAATKAPDTPDKLIEEPPLPVPLCIKCGIYPLEKVSKTGRYVADGKYLGLCGSCRKKAKVIDDAIALATEEDDGDWVICPKCQHSFLSPQKERA